jgi:hypothetical protein
MRDVTERSSWSPSFATTSALNTGPLRIVRNPDAMSIRRDLLLRSALLRVPEALMMRPAPAKTAPPPPPAQAPRRAPAGGARRRPGTGKGG